MKIAISIIGILLLLGGGVFVFLNLSHKPSSSITQTAIEPTPTPTDLAPSVSHNKKTTIVVRKDDSSKAVYIVPNSQIDMFIHSLPEGSTVVSQSKN